MHSHLGQRRYENELGEPYRGYVHPFRWDSGCTVLGVPVVGGPYGGRDFVGLSPSNVDASAFDKLGSPGQDLVDADMLVEKGNT